MRKVVRGEYFLNVACHTWRYPEMTVSDTCSQKEVGSSSCNKEKIEAVGFSGRFEALQVENIAFTIRALFKHVY